MVNMQPTFAKLDSFVPDALLYAPGEESGIPVQIAQNGAQTLDLARGTLLYKTGSGSPDVYAALPASPTVVAISATGEVIKNNLATTDLEIDFILAHPPIPGTVHLVTTADGSATPILDLGTDDGRGVGAGAGGSFTIDYVTGRGRVVLASAPTATNDLKTGYKHQGTTQGVSAMPTAILAEDVTATAIVAGAVVTAAYNRGVYNRNKIIGYDTGYEEWLNTHGIWTKAAVPA